MKQYTIQKGDTLWKISKSNGVSLEALIAANPQISNPDVIQIGQVISIPTSPGVGSDAALVEPSAAPVGEPPVATESTVSQAEVVTPTEVVTAEKAETVQMGTPAVKAETASTPSKWGQMWKYVVKPGDTMWKIAKQAGITLDQLVAANPQVANPDQIQTGQVLNIPSGSMLWKEKATAPTQVAPSAMNKKEMLTMPKPTAVAPITTEVPVMEKKFELPPLEFPKMQPQLPNINVPINIPIEANDVIQQKTYNIGPVGNKTYSAPVMQGPISSDPVTQAPVYAPMATAPMAMAPASVYSMHHHHMHHNPHCICKTVIHGPGCTCFIKHKHHMHHHMMPHCHVHYSYVHPHAYVEPYAYMPTPHYGGGYYQSPVAYGSAQTGAPGELGPYSYQPYQPTHQSASIHS